MPLDVVRVIVESAITVYYPTTKNRREKLTKKVEWAGSKKYDEATRTAVNVSALVIDNSL